MKKNVVIIGFGEVGQPITTMCEENNYETYIIDNNKKIDEVIESAIKEFDYLHICIPYNDKFEQDVIDYIYQLNPKLTIIHSTIKPGTTAFIQFKTNKKVVHSPVKGIHPFLYQSYKTFKKFIGVSSKDTFNIAKEHLSSIGFNVEYGGTSDETELSKILSTSYYAWNIIWCKEVNKMCKNLGLNFENVYTKLNKDYNQGYLKLGFSQYVRPVLKPIKGKFGGHCIKANLEILNGMRLTKLAQFMLNEDKMYKYDI